MGETMRLNGVNLYFERHGEHGRTDRPPLVLIHGYLSSCFSFRRLIPHLRNDYPIFALDLPGFGRSEKSPAFHYSLENYGKLVLDFLRAHDIKEAVLIGHSMGGQIALQAAYQDATRVLKVVGLAAAGYMGRVRRSLVMLSYTPFFHRLLKLYFAKKDVMAEFLSVTHDRSIITQEMMDGYLEPLKETAFYRSLVRLMRHREGDLPPAALHRIQTPVLLIWGDKDRIVPPDIGLRFVRDLPNAELIVFENVGHLIPEERPEETAARIRAFLESNEPAR
ncbi:alpha/beta fold hydrolase [Caenibacillus caldisaponilyticus]|uniref:alpha/beta fold hydrolase n=1 Tax=Caenibacillus caldisaponilyticus TaxID=1674942 RepID=UPI0013018D15|nr:alpha/beta hydrolase [Caenibacillus caldisaponilyticus]